MTALVLPPAETGKLTRCRVLYLTHHLPWPPWSGGSLREFCLLTSLVKQFTIELVAVGRRSPEPDARLVSTRPGVHGAEFYSDESRRTTRRQRFSAAARARLSASADQFGSAAVVHVEGGYLFHLLPPALQRRACLVEHNVESDVLLQFARLSGDVRLLKTARRVKDLEDRAWRSAAAVMVLTGEDRDRIAQRVGRNDVRIVPNGYDHLPAGRPFSLPESTPATAVFLANYAYRPNADALQWLLDAIWPEVVKARPDARLVLAGSMLSTTQRSLAAGAPNVDVAGLVPDVVAVLDGADLLIAPLRAGGGIKVKMLEALRRGCPVVTTTVGAQGIHGAARAALRIDDTAAGLTKAVLDLFDARKRSADLRAETLRAGANLPTWSDAAAALSAIWSEIGGHDG